MKKITLLSVVLALLGTASMLQAQSATGQITGTVKDSTGAVVPGATVTAISELTGSKREATTSTDGNYVFPLLSVSVYSVSAELQGFRPAKRTGVRLNVDQVVPRRPGAAAGRADGGGRGPGGGGGHRHGDGDRRPGDHREADHGPSPQRAELPVPAVPGRGRGRDRRASRERCGRASGSAISLMGARPTSNNFMIDGTSNIDTALGTPAAILSVDAMEEFKEQTKTYSAEYGFSANQINLVSKSGTNEYHGALFYFGRDEALDAKNFFDSPTAEKPDAGPEAVRGDGRRSDHQEQDFPARQLRGGADRAGVQHLLHRADSGPAGGPVRDDDHRPRHRPAVPEQHHPLVALLASGPADAAEPLVPRSERQRAPGQLPAGPDASPDPEPVHRCVSTRTWAASEERSHATRRRRTRTRPAGR